VIHPRCPELAIHDTRTWKRESDILIEPKVCALVLVDQQAGLAFGVGSMDRNMLLKDVIVLARTATI
jgi:hypothetical protein